MNESNINALADGLRLLFCLLLFAWIWISFGYYCDNRRDRMKRKNWKFIAKQVRESRKRKEEREKIEMEVDFEE